MHQLKLIAVALLGTAAVGCAGVQETRLATNVVRLDVTPPAAPLGSDALLRRAAELTLQSGYSAFRLSPIYSEAFNNYGVVVVMFSAGNPEARGALDAASVINRTSF